MVVQMRLRILEITPLSPLMTAFMVDEGMRIITILEEALLD